MAKIRTGSLILALVATVTATAFAAGENGGTDEQNVSSLKWQRSYAHAASEARRRKRPILVRITATWCGPCRQMSQLTFQDERVRRRLRRDFVLLELDADEHPELVTGFKVQAYPTTIVVSPELTVVTRLTGFQSASDLVTVLRNVRITDSTDASDVEDAEDSNAVSALVPENVKTFAFSGFCLTSLLDDNKLREGSREFTADYRGQSVCFHSEECRRKFLADPERYWPVANGQCLVSSREGRSTTSGDPRVGVIWRGRLWFFSDRETQQRFIQTPHHYAGS